MKKVILLTFIFIFVFVSFAIAAEFWASKNSNKYHYPSCEWAQRISKQNLIIFKSPEDAVRAGYVPCKVCRPPVVTQVPNKKGKVK